MSTQAKRRRLISGLMQNSDMEIPESEPFFVKSGNIEFSDRQTNIFSGLNDLEAKHLQFQETMKPIENIDDENGEENEVIEDKFKIPLVPVRRSVARKPMKRSPDYILHPEKWTKYSLADVTDDQMSDKSNYTVALSFLSERKRMINEEESDDEQDSNRKIIFKSQTLKNSESSNEKSSFQSGKWIMPEYVIGKDTKATKSSKTSTEKSTSKAVELSHLNQDDSENQKDDADDGKELKLTQKTGSKQTLKMDVDETNTETSKFKAYNKGKRYFKKREENDY